MTHWDDIVTDPRLRLSTVECHLAGLTSDAYLHDEFHAVASGGSSGHRGVFVHGWEAWADGFAGIIRTTMWDRLASPDIAAAPNTMAMVAASHASQMTNSRAGNPDVTRSA